MRLVDLWSWRRVAVGAAAEFGSGHVGAAVFGSRFVGAAFGAAFGSDWLHIYVDGCIFTPADGGMHCSRAVSGIGGLVSCVTGSTSSLFWHCSGSKKVVPSSGVRAGWRTTTNKNKRQ